MSFFTDTYTGIALLILGQCLLVTVLVLVSLAFLMYGDRKIWAAVQMRKGPNVVGAFGLLQSFADFGKYIVKEIVVPAGADRPVYFLAPMVAFCLPMIVWVAIPFNEGWVISDLNVAILYIFAISSLEVYGIIMGGWASNSKYPFLGSLRSAAQMISYEVSIGLIIIGVVISTGSLNLTEIVKAQDGAGGILNWYVLPHLPMFFLFFISALAETNRPPFDLPEAESELVAGYQVEYSSTPFLLFMIGELMAVWMMCAIISLLFLGGWLSPLPFLPDGFLWMLLKMIFCFFIFSMVKAITPRYRYDQLMRIGWKVFLPLSLAWVVIVAFLAKFEVAGGFWARWEQEPATLSEFMDQSCSDSFAVVATDAPALMTLLEDNPPNRASTYDEATRAAVFAYLTGLFVANVDISDGEAPMLREGVSGAVQTEMAAANDLAGCLIAEHGSVIQGTDVNDQGDVGFDDIRGFVGRALAGGEG